MNNRIIKEFINGNFRFKYTNNTPNTITTIPINITTMTKIEELHMNVCDERPDSYNLSAHAKVTEDIACKFAEWMDKEMCMMHKTLVGYWYRSIYSKLFTTSELFQEFTKTL